MRKLCLIFLIAQTAHAAQWGTTNSFKSSPTASSPNQLLSRYAGTPLVEVFKQYAQDQGATSQAEMESLVTHELIHVESARTRRFWRPTGDLDGYMGKWDGRMATVRYTAQETPKIQPLQDMYLNRNPNNTISNTLDELNAYSLTLPDLCKTARNSAERHLPALAAHLVVLNAALRTEKALWPSSWSRNRPLMVRTVTVLARQAASALQQCGYPIPENSAIQQFISG